MSAMLWFRALLTSLLLALAVALVGVFIPPEQRSGPVLGGYLLLWAVAMAWAGINAMRNGSSGLFGAAAAGAAVGCVLVSFFRGMSRWRAPTPWLPDRLIVMFQPVRVIAAAAVIGLAGAWLMTMRETRDAA